jgi:hypothetical protein
MLYSSIVNLPSQRPLRGNDKMLFNGFVEALDRAINRIMNDPDVAERIGLCESKRRGHRVAPWSPLENAA